MSIYIVLIDGKKFVLPSFQDGKKAISVSAMEITGDSLFG